MDMFQTEQLQWIRMEVGKLWPMTRMRTARSVYVAANMLQQTCAKLKCCMHKLSNLQKVDLRKSPLKLWTCKRLKFN